MNIDVELLGWKREGKIRISPILTNNFQTFKIPIGGLLSVDQIMKNCSKREIGKIKECNGKIVVKPGFNKDLIPWNVKGGEVFLAKDFLDSCSIMEKIGKLENITKQFENRVIQKKASLREGSLCFFNIDETDFDSAGHMNESKILKKMLKGIRWSNLQN